MTLALSHKALWESIVPITVAEQQKFFEKYNLDVTVKWLDSGVDSTQVVASGQADIGLNIGILAAVGAYSKGIPIKIVSAEDRGGEFIWYTKSNRDDISSIKDLAGKTVGTNKPGTSAYINTRLLQEAAGVDFKIAVVGGMPAQLTQVLSGQIDVGYGVPPTSLQEIHDGKLKVIAESRTLFNKTQQEYTDRVNIANAKLMESNRDAVVRFMKAWSDTLNWMYADEANYAASVKIFADFNKLPEDLARKGAEYYGGGPGDFVGSRMVLGPITQMDLTIKDAQAYEFVPKDWGTDEQLKGLIDMVLGN